MISLWQDAVTDAPSADPWEPGSRFDIVIVGAGLTGLATAHMLAQAGKSVAVVEARSAGAVATGRSTAKLSLLHSGALAGIRAHVSSAVLRAYVDGNRQGQEWLLEYLHTRGVPVQRRDAVSYATTPEGVSAVDDEKRAALDAGLPVVDGGDLGLPFETHAALRLPDQAQFDPLQVVHALMRDVQSAGGRVFEGIRVTGVDAGEPSVVRTDAGDVIAGHVILATGAPILDRGLYFAKLSPMRSYALAFRVPGLDLAPGMYLSLDAHTRSLRTAPRDGEELLLVGGDGHPVGRSQPTARHIAELEAWTAQNFAGAVRTHAWSAQDYRSANRIPFVGWMPRSGGAVSLATGFAKWGMTNAIAAALSLTADRLGTTLPWARTIHHRITRPVSLASGVAANAQVAASLVTGWADAELHPLPDRDPAEGEGVVGGDRLAPVAVSNVDGVVCRLSAVCTHLGGIVTWNDAERSWDCPLHGSRFDARGRVLEGPATHGLRHAGDPAP